MKRAFEFDLFRESVNAQAELFVDEETRLKVVVTVFERDGLVDFRGTIYTNPSWPEFESLIKKSEEELLDEGIARFLKQFDFERNVPLARESGINVIINWVKRA